MSLGIDTLFVRRPKLHYVAPPVCDISFSNSSISLLILNELSALESPTGPVLGGVGSVFFSWDTVPGAICYSIYRSNDSNDPFGTYTLVAECLASPPVDLTPFGTGYYRVSAITPNGETPPSIPVHFIGAVPVVCPTITGGPPTDSITTTEGSEVILGPFLVDEGSGGGPVIYQWFKDSVFLVDTTSTSKAFLDMPSSVIGDTGSYELHLSNLIGYCALSSSPIALIVNPPGACCDCGTPVKITGYNAANFTFNAASHIFTGLVVANNVPVNSPSFSIPDNGWLSCTGVIPGGFDVGNAFSGFIQSNSAWFMISPAGWCDPPTNTDSKVLIERIVAYPAGTVVGGTYTIYNTPYGLGFGVPWDGKFTLTDPAHVTCAVQDFPSSNINGYGGFTVQLDRVPNGSNWDWTLTLTQYYTTPIFSTKHTLWTGTLTNNADQYGAYVQSGGFFTGPATITLEPA